MTAVVISQPMLFPWAGFFEQMMLADCYLWLDDAQFSKGRFTNRIQVLYGDERKWLTIPLAGKGSFQEIRHLAAAGDFRDGHLAFLGQAWKGRRYAAEALAIAADVYSEKKLDQLLIASAELPARWLGIRTAARTARTSAMAVPGTSSDRVLALVEAAGGTRYVTGHGAAGYLDHASFERAGIAVEYMAYSKTPWCQGAGVFTPYVSILDVIAALGREAVSVLHPGTVAWRAFPGTGGAALPELD